MNKIKSSNNRLNPADETNIRMSDLSLNSTANSFSSNSCAVSIGISEPPLIKINKEPSFSMWKKVQSFFKAVNQIKPQEDDCDSNRNTPGANSFLEKFAKPSIVQPIEENVERKNTFAFSNGIPIYQSEKPEHQQHLMSYKYLFINPEGTKIYVWLAIVGIAWLYNMWSLIARQSFTELQKDVQALWYSLDYLSDFIFLLDIGVQFRTGYLKNGLLVFGTRKLTRHYVKSWKFAVDVLALLPLDLIYINSPYVQPLIRFPRFLKLYRAKEFIRRAESRNAYPNGLRVMFLGHTLMLLMHWFACFYYMLSELEGFVDKGAERGWAYPLPANASSDSVWRSLRRKYLHSIYWSCLTLTTIGEKQSPDTDLQYICTLAAYFLGIFLFATIVGQVGNVISNKNADRNEYEKLTDNAKRFMKSKNVPREMQHRVLRWYSYSWSRGLMRGTADVNSLGMMPDTLKVELAIHVNLETLRKVSIFKLVQPEFLYDLVLKMRSYIFTPGDLICRKGEIAKEMYIISHGVLEVVGENGEVFALLRAGDFFGEIGVLNITGGVNKRVANVRSVGYSEVFSLAGDDVIKAMEYYPDAKKLLMMYGRQRLNINKAKSSSSEEEDNSSDDEITENNIKNGKMHPRVSSGHNDLLTPDFSTPLPQRNPILNRRERPITPDNKARISEITSIVMNCLKTQRNSSSGMSDCGRCSDVTLNSLSPRTGERSMRRRKYLDHHKKLLKQKDEQIKHLEEDVKLLMEKVEILCTSREKKDNLTKRPSKPKPRRLRNAVKTVTTARAFEKLKNKKTDEKDESNEANSSSNNNTTNILQDKPLSIQEDGESIYFTNCPVPHQSQVSPRMSNITGKSGTNTQTQTLSTVVDENEQECSHRMSTVIFNI